MSAYADHPKPWLVGMAVGLGVARALECQIRWPNDVVSRGKKIGGILTEMFEDAKGRRVPVVGIGVNVNQPNFPDEIAVFATSVYLEYGDEPEPVEVARAIIQSVRSLHEPTSWSVLSELWQERDDTPGKLYRSPTGEDAVAVGVGPEGELIATVDGKMKTFLAAEALFGRS
jgi:BirA family biotin operon repressor/biotin-[acetyl-CoA-carboxylase] ligase